MRLRRKITLAFFLVSTLVCVLLAFVLHRFIAAQLADELKTRLGDIAKLGAAEVELPAYQRLVQQLGPLDDAKVAAIEQGDDYKELYTHLRMLRSAEPALVRFAYLLAPTSDPDHPRFVADADVLELEAKAARGEAGAGEISHFARSYDVTKIPLLRRALIDCAPQVEPDFVWDAEYGASSMSAYAPLTDDDGHVLRDEFGRCLGVLGVDVTDRKMQIALASASRLSVWISFGAVALALVISIAMGTLLTKSVLSLSTTVKRFADKDFTARTGELSRDEIGILGTNFNEMAETIQVHNEQLEDLVRQRTRELEDEKQTSERLLLNVLPAPIADRLKSGAQMIVDRFDAVTVLFADLVGFTALSSKTSPEQLVTMLNELFSAFDQLAERHHLEKIKTIGDSYMVVAGIPHAIPDHAGAAARMAIDMLATIAEFATRTGTPLAVRIGLNTGPVVAGVIGQKKFIYDLWGDTVNTASRMESHGLAGRIQISETTRAALGDAFELEPRGSIEIKGKGAMATYLLVRERAPSTVATDQTAAKSI